VKKEVPATNPVNNTTPKQNPPQLNPEPNKLVDFGNFFGTGNA
jgi:hypothetical protein